jgi:hypothetical protein
MMQAWADYLDHLRGQVISSPDMYWLKQLIAVCCSLRLSRRSDELRCSDVTEND